MSSNRRIIFWYWVRCFFASFLKRFTLALLNAMVTLTLSRLNASSWGGGRKSAIIRSLPRGSFVYFIFSFIDSLSPSPISGAKDSDHVLPVSKPYGHDAATRFTKTVVTLLQFTMLKIFRNNAMRVRKSQLRKLKFDLREGKPVLVMLPEIDFIDDKAGGYSQGHRPPPNRRLWQLRR